MKNLFKSWQRFFATIKKQKKALIGCCVLFTGCLCTLINPNFAADISSSFSASQLNIEPQINVQPDTPTIMINDPVATGDFDITINFSVESNTQNVNMFVEATDFYFHKDPTAQVVDSIHIVESAGVEIDPQGATPNGGIIAAYTGDGNDIDGYPSRKTEPLSFQSSSAYTFNHPVAVTVTWNLERMKPAGEYSAWVKLTCIAVPPE